MFVLFSIFIYFLRCSDVNGCGSGHYSFSLSNSSAQTTSYREMDDGVKSLEYEEENSGNVLAQVMAIIQRPFPVL